MPVNALDKLNLLPFIKRIKSFPVTKLRKFDAVLSDTSNYVYDMDEAIGELPPRLNKLKKQQANALLSKLTILQSQLAEIINILYI